MGDGIRVQVYCFDMGAWHKSYICTIALDEIDELGALHRVVQLTEDNYYGEGLPQVRRDWPSPQPSPA